MAKYLLVYHGGRMPETDEERGKIMAAWGQWFQTLGSAVVDPGNPVGQTRTINNGSVSEGGGANPATGYSILEADSLERAVELSKGCPVLQGGATVEVAETFDVM